MAKVTKRHGSLRTSLSIVAGLTSIMIIVSQAIDASERPDLVRLARTVSLEAFEAELQSAQHHESVELWLSQLGRGHLRSTRWTSGRCRLIRTMTPLDVGGTGARCATATLSLVRPTSPGDQPQIEIFFERAAGDRWTAYAFRGLILTRDGEEYARFPSHFEAAWKARFDRR